MEKIQSLSKVPSRSYCSACKKQSHGRSCKKGNCQCTFGGIPCRDLTAQQIRELKRIQRDDPEFVYTPENDKLFEEIMSGNFK